MGKYHDYLEPDCFYHIYNRAIGNENLFREERNYAFFLDKWQKFLLPYIDVWEYCLMPNHFHFLVQIRTNPNFPSDTEVNKFLENQFKRLFSSYALSFNKVYKRNGSLFQKSFKRIKVDSENYLLSLIHYIHHNPIHHGFVDDYTKWRYSSYKTILSKKATKLNRKEVMQFSGGRKAFINFHDEMKSYRKISHLIIEH